MGPASIKMLAWVMECDHSGRGSLPKGAPKFVTQMVEMAEAEHCREEKVPQILMGQDLIDHLGLRPGREFGVILKAAFEAQVEGAFSTKEEAVEWARGFIAP